jgi:beta propeller repeat protein
MLQARMLSAAFGWTLALSCVCLGLSPNQSDSAHAATLSADHSIDSAQFVLKPSISGDRMVYVRSERGSHSVWLEDLRTGSLLRLSDDNRSSDAPDIHGNRVVWQESRHSGSVIVLYDLETRDATVLTEGYRDTSPSVWGDRVVWTRQSGVDSWLMFMDLGTGYEGALVPVGVGTTAALSDTTVVHDNGGDLYLLDLHSAEEVALVTSPYRTEFPDIDGDTVVYARWGGGLSEIHALDTRTGESEVIVSDGYCAYAPAIDGDTVAWESYCVPRGSEVHAARLPSDSPFVTEQSSFWARVGLALEVTEGLAWHLGSLHLVALQLLLG